MRDARHRVLLNAAVRIVCVLGLPWHFCSASETPYLYGIHDFDPRPDSFLSRLEGNGVRGTITATEAVGHDPADRSGKDYGPLASRGHRIIARLNNGYFPHGTIPLPEKWDDFARRCANFVAASSGCTIWVIGNETNLSGEWPSDGGYRRYIAPEAYADCFRRVYDRIKAVRPTHRVIPQALAPFAGPYGAGADHDGMPIDHVTYMRRMLSAIRSSGGVDGVAVHINSRGYSRADVFSEQKVNGNWWSFFCYKDWLERGMPSSMWSLPVYATECNGYYFWKGGHAEAPHETYEPGWVQTVLLEVDRWNHNEALAYGRPVIHSVSFYRWCASCDGWNIDGAPQEGQILADLEEATGYRLAVPERGSELSAPFELVIDQTTPPLDKNEPPYYGVWRSFPFRVTGSSPVDVMFMLRGTAQEEGDDDDARLLLDGDSPTDDATWNSEAALDGSRDRGSVAEAVFTRTLSPKRYVLRLQIDSTPHIDRIVVTLPNAAAPFRRGAAAGAAALDIADAVFILSYLFAGGSCPSCLDAADANDDGAIDIADAVAVLRHLFGGHGDLPAPAEACGPDPTPDDLGCDSFPACQ